MRISAIFWINYLLVFPAVAQEIQFQARVDRTSISQSEYALIIFAIKFNPTNPAPPGKKTFIKVYDF